MGNDNGNFKSWSGIRVTFGEILATGVVLDSVESSSGDGVELVRWDGQNFQIGPRFKEGQTIYTAGHLHPSLLDATRLARGLADYGDPTKLFWKIVGLFRDHIRLSREHDVVITPC